MSKLPVLFPSKTREGKPGCYLITVDLDQKEKYSFKGENGEMFTLYTPREQSNNLKDKNPNVVSVVGAFGDVDFGVGDTLFIDHYVVKNHDDSSNEIWSDENGTKYWKVENHDVFACVNDKGELTPNSGILLCEYITEKLLDTELELSDSLIGVRQDIAKVAYSNDEKFPAGSYILVEDYALYEIDYDGKKYAKVDVNMNDIMAVVYDPNWRKDHIINMNLSDVNEQV